MKLIKIFGFVLLLLSGYSGNATTFVQEFDLSDDNPITAEVSEDFKVQLQSTLTTAQVLDFNIYNGNHPYQNFVFRSHLKAGEAEMYINLSRSIVPSHGIPEIIFPFHSFL